ncbi:MAG: zinc ribbon domain-containing protein [Methanobrevibacter sp.]|nr:zinc ribbon domain-containing protein [Candidatus Methanovirga meridionalis]
MIREKLCHKCGNHIKDGDLFCENCGTKIKSSDNKIVIKTINITLLVILNLMY